MKVLSLERSSMRLLELADHAPDALVGNQQLESELDVEQQMAEV